MSKLEWGELYAGLVSKMYKHSSEILIVFLDPVIKFFYFWLG